MEFAQTHSTQIFMGTPRATNVDYIMFAPDMAILIWCHITLAII